MMMGRRMIPELVNLNLALVIMFCFPQEDGFNILQKIEKHEYRTHSGLDAALDFCCGVHACLSTT
jgi:hypothetical protein